MSNQFISNQQVSLLPERIRKAYETKARYEVYDFLYDLWKKKNAEPLTVIVVGTGGSYVSALCIAHSISDEMRTADVQAVTPQTALRKIKQFDMFIDNDSYPKFDVVIAISYSGKTPDIKAVYDICRGDLNRQYQFMLVTGADKTELEDLYEENEEVKIISYFNPADNTGKEKGMISMFSTIAPVVVFDNNNPFHGTDKYDEIFDDGEKFVSKLNIEKIADTVKKYPVVHVLYEWRTFPTAKDIESKLIESGVANVVLHEKKNFSHGRSTVLYNQDFALVINLTCYGLYTSSKELYYHTDYNTDYDKALAEFLKKICESKSACYVEIGSAVIFPSEWNLREMGKIVYLVSAIGEAMKIDISKPLSPYPKDALALYDYKGEF